MTIIIKPDGGGGGGISLPINITDVTGLTGQLSKRRLLIQMFNYDESVTNGDIFKFRVPTSVDGLNLESAKGYVNQAGTTNATTISLYNGATNMLTTAITINSASISGVGVVDVSESEVTEGDELTLTVTGVSTTPPNGLFIELIFG